MGVINARFVYDQNEAKGIDIEFEQAVMNFMKSQGFREIDKLKSDTRNRALLYSRVLKKETP